MSWTLAAAPDANPRAQMTRKGKGRSDVAKAPKGTRRGMWTTWETRHGEEAFKVSPVRLLSSKSGQTPSTFRFEAGSLSRTRQPPAASYTEVVAFLFWNGVCLRFGSSRRRSAQSRPLFKDGERSAFSLPLSIRSAQPSSLASPSTNKSTTTTTTTYNAVHPCHCCSPGLRSVTSSQLAPIPSRLQALLF